MLINLVKRFKPFYSIFNFFQYSKLKYNIPLFKKYNLNKWYFSNLSSSDFKHLKKAETPWLDYSDSKVELYKNAFFNSLSEKTKLSLANWSCDGYAILENIYTKNDIDFINKEVDFLLINKKIKWKYKNKLMFSIKKSKKLLEIVDKPEVNKILALLLGRNINAFQSINFYNGSQQAAHSDIVHMTTFPQGYLIAIWIALEDVGEEQGPLFYYPGSHKLPYFLNDDFTHGGNQFFIGQNAYKNYEIAIQKEINSGKFEKKTFHAKKGDVLIWHANLLHGGSPIINKNLTRKSMVLHYFAEDVICYHEITQRPALISR